jgi:hypothetical protein
VKTAQDLLGHTNPSRTLGLYAQGIDEHKREAQAQITTMLGLDSVGSRPRLADADDLSHDAADLSGRIKLALALATLRGEVTHEVLVCVAQNVITFGTVLGEVERWVLEDGNQIREPIHHLLAATELGGVVEVRKIRKFVGIRQRSDDLFVDLVTDIRLALQGDHVPEAGPRWNSDGGKRHASVFVADVLNKEQHKNVVLVLACVHAAAQFVATGPK